MDNLAGIEERIRELRAIEYPSIANMQELHRLRVRAGEIHAERESASDMLERLDHNAQDFAECDEKQP